MNGYRDSLEPLRNRWPTNLALLLALALSAVLLIQKFVEIV
jgi:hypothetical protein